MINSAYRKYRSKMDKISKANKEFLSDFKAGDKVTLRGYPCTMVATILYISPKGRVIIEFPDGKEETLFGRAQNMRKIRPETTADYVVTHCLEDDDHVIDHIYREDSISSNSRRLRLKFGHCRISGEYVLIDAEVLPR